MPSSRVRHSERGLILSHAGVMVMVMMMVAVYNHNHLRLRRIR